MMTDRPVRVGMLTPSSNTVLEPMLARMTAAAEDAVTIHYSRFRVTEIALSEAALGQFDAEPMVRAAELLAHAKVDAITWNGTSAAWMGFAQDEVLCERIRSVTGIPATTSVLAYREAFRCLGASRIGLVTPYTGDVQARIAANWGAAGFVCSAERHLALSDNFSFAEVSEQKIGGLIRDVAREGCDAIAIVCTNMRGAKVAAALEQELGLSVLDSVAVTLWASLGLVGADMRAFSRWGRLFAQPWPAASIRS